MAKRGRKPKSRSSYYGSGGYSSGWGWYPRSSKPLIEPGTGIRGNRNYGTTWWGQQWLNAFNQISDENRLPRGRTYANNGYVRSIDIQQNLIKAKVQGSRLYDILIQIPEFTAAEQKEIIHIVTENPDLLAGLLNRELPPDLNEACQREGIDIFPRRWSNFKASCSCPDWAMPCKHLAAVIYLIANEIDKNPFMVFELHGFDLPKALENAGFSAAQTRQLHVLKLAELQKPHDPDAVIEPLTASGEDLEDLDFSTIPDCSAGLLTILTEKPVFAAKGDFKALFGRVLSRAARFAEKETRIAAEEAGDLEEKYDQAEIVEITINADTLEPLKFQAWAASEETVFKTAGIIEFIRWLKGVPAGKLDHLATELKGIWLAWRFAEACARQSAMVPQLLACDQPDTFVVRWLPALLNEQVRSLFKKIQALLPAGMLHLEKGEDDFVPVNEDYALGLISIFLGHYIRSGDALAYDQLQEPVNKLFFWGEAVTFDKFENREYGANIALWLNRFFIAEKQWIPVLSVTEGEDGNFEMDLAAENRDEPLKAPVSLKTIFQSKDLSQWNLSILRDLSTIVEFLPDLKVIIASKGKEKLVINPVRFADVLFQSLPVVRLLGIKVLLPKALNRILHPQLSLRLGKVPGQIVVKTLMGLRQILSYQWQIAVGDRQLGPDEFLSLVRQYKGLVKIHGEYVYFDEKEVAALVGKLSNPPKITDSDLLQIALSEEYDGAPIQFTPELQELMDSLLQVGQLPPPSGLNATLRPYQLRGFSWLVKNARLGFGSILADDMGLGKTLQVIATLQQMKEDELLKEGSRALVIAPTTLLTNWQKEINRFAPGLTSHIFHGPNRELKQALESDVVLTSYGIARSDAAMLNKQNWLALVIDEAQNVKNPAAEQSKAVKKIPAPIRIAMSGTPVENRLSEYWSVFDFSNQGFLGGLKKFRENFAVPIEGKRDQKALRKFRKLTGPFVMRRLKTDKSIISDLPEKVEQDQFCQLTPAQAALYQAEVEKTMKKIEESDGIARRGLVLQLIMALKQICNHPVQYAKKGKPDPALSGKCPLLLDLVEQAVENDEKTLIFTQFREMGELLAPMLAEKFGGEVPFLHGGVSRTARDKMVDDFQTLRTNRILLLSLKAGGTGLNLTAASQVIHFDLWWNPAVEAQATDRAYRIGQKRNVQVHRFITTGTFEEKINAMLGNKKELADLTVTSGETWIGELPDQELRDLFRLA